MTNSGKEFTWCNVALSDTTDEQTFTTGEGVLNKGRLSHPPRRLPTFYDTDTHTIIIQSVRQDRELHITTEPNVTDGNVSFGVTLSEAGVSGVPYFDIHLLVS